MIPSPYGQRLSSLYALQRRVREERLRRLGFAELTEEERRRNLENNLDWFCGSALPDACPGELSLEERTHQ